MNLLATIWSAIPAAMRKHVGVGISVGLGLAIPLTVWLLWASGYLPKVFGIDQHALDRQTRDITHANARTMEEIADHIVHVNDSTLRDYMQNERKLAEDTILRPLLHELVELKKAQKHMLFSLNMQEADMQQTTARLDEKLERILSRYEPERTEEQMNELMLRMEQITNEISEIMEWNRTINEEMRGRPIKRQRF